MARQVLIDARLGPGNAKLRILTDKGLSEAFRMFNATSLKEVRIAFETGIIRAGKIAEDELRSLYRSGVSGHKSLHPLTISEKGHGRPLFDQGDMANAVKSTILPKGKDQIDISVGFPPGKESMKASIAENGIVLKVTPKMRSFLASRGLRLKSTTRFLRVPARPVFPTAVKRAQPKMEQAVQDQLRRTFLGKRLSRS